MIRSMTGFGRYEEITESMKLTVEMKSVNHRYLDLNIKMPKKLNSLENNIRTELKKYISRGKVDVFITIEEFGEAEGSLRYNKALAAEYLKYMKQMKDDFDLEDDVRLSMLARCPEVLSMEDKTMDEEELWKVLEKALRGAAEGFVKARSEEGERLRQDLMQKLDNMLELTAFITERSPQLIKDYRDKLEAKVKDLLGDKQVDETRLLTEVTIFADKVCVDEELVRLKSHIESVKATLIDGKDIGRKLDFIAQEMNREANTILSKANDLEISQKAIELKNEIEKVREQIQNIE